MKHVLFFFCKCFAVSALRLESPQLASPEREEVATYMSLPRFSQHTSDTSKFCSANNQFILDAKDAEKSYMSSMNSLSATLGTEDWCPRSGRSLELFQDAILSGLNISSSDFAAGVPSFMTSEELVQSVYSDASLAGNRANFDNLGYSSDADVDLPQVTASCNSLPGPQYPVFDKIGHRMYHFMITDGLEQSDVMGRRLLEVGCGRGKGAAYIAQTFQPLSYTGVDLNEERIKIARTYWGHTQNLDFITGNAMDLPFNSSSHDLVLNVESSFHYPNFTKFVLEVHRVLRPGGLFVWTAPLYGEKAANKESIFVENGFEIQKKMDITANVLRSLDEWMQESDVLEYNRLVCLPSLLAFTRKSPTWANTILPVHGPLRKAYEEGKYYRFILKKRVSNS